MARVNVAEAKARLSELIDAALQGEEVIIARRNTAVVRLTALKAPVPPKPGRLKGRIRMAADFDVPLADFTDYMPKAVGAAKRKKRS
jgi:prevent-host-death family protein